MRRCLTCPFNNINLLLIISGCDRVESFGVSAMLHLKQVRQAGLPAIEQTDR